MSCDGSQPWTVDHYPMLYACHNRTDWLSALQQAKPGDEIKILAHFDMTDSPIKLGVIYHDVIRSGAKYRLPLPEEIPPLKWSESARYDVERNETVFRITGQKKSMFFSEIRPVAPDDDILASKNEYIRQMEATIAQLEKKINSLEKQVKEKDYTIKELEESLAIRRSQVAEMVRECGLDGVSKKK